MTNQTERLKKLDDHKLIDVVKNYRQYGYDEVLQLEAIAILKERGISKEELRITGNLENRTYTAAEELYKSFRNNSKITFILYGIILLSSLGGPFLLKQGDAMYLLNLGISWTAFIAYFIFLIRAFLNQNRFYKVINQDYGAEGLIVYVLLGMPFYLIMYFYFGNQMKDKMQEIR